METEQEEEERNTTVPAILEEHDVTATAATATTVATVSSTTTTSIAQPFHHHHYESSTTKSLLLDTIRFWYQNNITGNVSTTPLSLRQLCRIVGMSVIDPTPTTTTSTTITTTTTQQPPLRHLTADTNILFVDDQHPQTNTNSNSMSHTDDSIQPSLSASTSHFLRQSLQLPETWQSLRTIPVLREVVTPWYYYIYRNPNDPISVPQSSPIPPNAKSPSSLSSHNTSNTIEHDHDDDDDDGTNHPMTMATSTTQGPITCRDLAQILHSSPPPTIMYVASTITNMTWNTIDQLPFLQWALLAFPNDIPPTNAAADKYTRNKLTAIEVESVSSTPAITIPEEDTIQAELEAFLQSTNNSSNNMNNNTRNQKRNSSHGNNDDDDIHHDNNNNNDDECSYESDQGTRYIKDATTGNWIHEALQQPKPAQSSKEHAANPSNQHATTTASGSTDPSSSSNNNNHPNQAPTKKKNHKKPKFANKYSRNWIYVTGLPTTSAVTESDIAAVFSKAGLLDLDPVTQLPKIKLYRHTAMSKTNTSSSRNNNGDDTGSNSSQVIGALKGDASICYARPESVALAMTLFDDTPFFYDDRIPPKQQQRMTVQAAKFVPHDTPETLDTNNATSSTKRHAISSTQRKVAKLATKQAMDWDEDGNYNNGRITGGKKGLCIIVLKHTFDPNTVQQQQQQPLDKCGPEPDDYFATLEQELRIECEQFGTVEKITFFTSHPEGVTIVKFVQPLAASDAVQRFNRQLWKGQQLMASFWDGVTDYTTKKDAKQEEEEMAVREEEFGDWLETQELPEELQLQTF